MQVDCSAGRRWPFRNVDSVRRGHGRRSRGLSGVAERLAGKSADGKTPGRWIQLPGGVKETTMKSKRRQQIEREIEGEIRAHNGFSCFWATENQERASVLTSMIKRGIIEATPKQYPWTFAKLKRQQTNSNVRWTQLESDQLVDLYENGGDKACLTMRVIAERINRSEASCWARLLRLVRANAKLKKGA